MRATGALSLLAALVLTACGTTVVSTFEVVGSRQPSNSAAPSASSSAPTPYDGVWASDPLTRDDVAAAIERRGLSDEHLDQWYPDWDEIDYRVLEIEIGQGRWYVYENGEGVYLGIPFAGELTLADPHTIVFRDDQAQCPVTFDLNRDGDTLSIHVADDACPDPSLAGQATIYESSPFHLVQAADWTPPAAPSESPASSPAGSQASTSLQRQTARPIGSVDGAPLGYVEYLPPSYGSQPSPLLVFLHGSGESGIGDEHALATLTAAGIPSLIAADKWPDERPFVVLSPQHNEDEPSFCLEADEIDAFLRFALAHYDIDQSRVYLTGLSCGAIGLWNYLAAHGGELVAATVPIAGYGIGAVELTGCDLARVPIWAFHGSADENVPVRGDVYPLTTLQACTDPAPADARLTIYPDAPHDVWTQTYRSSTYDIYDWLLSHHK